MSLSYSQCATASSETYFPPQCLGIPSPIITAADKKIEKFVKLNWISFVTLSNIIGRSE